MIISLLLGGLILLLLIPYLHLIMSKRSIDLLDAYKIAMGCVRQIILHYFCR